jgi:hypothetical protein
VDECDGRACALVHEFYFSGVYRSEIPHCDFRSGDVPPAAFAFQSVAAPAAPSFRIFCKIKPAVSVTRPSEVIDEFTLG